MFKKFSIMFLVVIFSFSSPAYAEDFVVEALMDFDIQNPPPLFSVKTVKDIYVTDFDKIEKGSVIKGQIKGFKPPRRLERDAYAVFVPTSYTIPSEGNREVVMPSFVKSKISPHSHVNKAEVAANTSVMAVTHFIPLLNIVVPVLQFAAGVAVSSDTEHPVKASLHAMVEGWPLCYCLKGSEISIKAGTELEISLNEKMFKSAIVKQEAI